MEYYGVTYSQEYLEHHGIKGMRWGVRRYQNPDGSLTEAGKKRALKGAYKLAKKTLEKPQVRKDGYQGRKLPNGAKVDGYQKHKLPTGTIVNLKSAEDKWSKLDNRQKNVYIAAGAASVAAILHTINKRRRNRAALAWIMS